MATTVYNQGLDLLQDWTTSTYKFLLLKSTAAAFDRDLNFVADIVAASAEISAAGYSRQTAGTKTRTVDDTNNRIAYDCADPSFGSLTAGQTVGRMVLYKEVTNDADSLLILDFDIADTATDGNPFPVTLNAIGVAYAIAGAGS